MNFFNKIDSHGDRVGLQIILGSPAKASTLPSSSPLSSTLPSSSSVSPSTSNTRSLPGKFACIRVKSFLDYEWYVFDISDHIEHNQAPPPPKYISSFTHDDDDCPVVNLKPIATAKKLRGDPGWAILGSNSVYMIDDDDWRGDNSVYRIDLSNTSAAKLKRLPQMPKPMTSSAHTLVVGGKFYSLGGYHLDDNDDDDFLSLLGGYHLDDSDDSDDDDLLSLLEAYPKPADPWAVAYDAVLNEWECLPNPPYIPNDNIFTAAIEVAEPRIVVGSCEDGLLQIYNVNTKEWEKHEFAISPKFSLRPNVLTGSALAVGSRLYWYSVVDYPCLVMYDLMTKTWCVGNFSIHDYGETFGATESDTSPRLAHLNGDEFCLLWVSVLQSVSLSKDDCISRLHCMKIRVTSADLCSESEIISLDVSILSCQSYLASGFKSFCGGLVVDGHSRYSDV